MEPVRPVSDLHIRVFHPRVQVPGMVVGDRWENPTRFTEPVSPADHIRPKCLLHPLFLRHHDCEDQRIALTENAPDAALSPCVLKRKSTSPRLNRRTQPFLGRSLVLPLESDEGLMLMGGMRRLSIPASISSHPKGLGDSEEWGDIPRRSRWCEFRWTQRPLHLPKAKCTTLICV
jgi:hypothetical protein